MCNLIINSFSNVLTLCILQYVYQQKSADILSLLMTECQHYTYKSMPL